jgi:hypothetical protein
MIRLKDCWFEQKPNAMLRQSKARSRISCTYEICLLELPPAGVDNAEDCALFARQ